MGPPFIGIANTKKSRLARLHKGWRTHAYSCRPPPTNETRSQNGVNCELTRTGTTVSRRTMRRVGWRHEKYEGGEAQRRGLCDPRVLFGCSTPGNAGQAGCHAHLCGRGYAAFAAGRKGGKAICLMTVAPRETTTTRRSPLNPIEALPRSRSGSSPSLAKMRQALRPSTTKDRDT